MPIAVALAYIVLGNDRSTGAPLPETPRRKQ